MCSLDYTFGHRWLTIPGPRYRLDLSPQCPSSSRLMPAWRLKCGRPPIPILPGPKLVVGSRGSRIWKQDAVAMRKGSIAHGCCARRKRQRHSLPECDHLRSLPLRRQRCCALSDRVRPCKGILELERILTCLQAASLAIYPKPYLPNQTCM